MSPTLKRRESSREQGKLVRPVRARLGDVREPGGSTEGPGSQSRDGLLRGAWIDGRAVFAATGATFPAVDPWTGRVLAQVAECGEREIDRAVFTARRALEAGAWPGMSAGRRAQVLFKFAELIETRSGELALLEARDTGRPLNQTLHTELPRAVATLRELAAQGVGAMGDTAQGRAGRGAWTLERARPRGVVAAVTSWQSPLLDAAWAWGSAWMAGCTLVAKPAPEASLLTLRLGAVAAEAGLPAGVLNILPGPAECGAALVSHQSIDGVVFTGRRETLAQVRATAAPAGVPVIADTGGLCPTLVLGDANPETAAEQAADAAFAFAGQLRRSASRVLVAAPVADAFLARLGEVSADRVAGDPTRAGTVLGPMIATGRAEYARWIAQRCLGHGGRRVVADVDNPADAPPDEGGVVHPRVFETADRQCPAVRRAVVGPLLAVTVHDTSAELVAAAQDLMHANAADAAPCPAAGVYTRDLSAAHRVAERLPCEQVYLNALDPYGHTLDAAALRTAQRVTAVMR